MTRLYAFGDSHTRCAVASGQFVSAYAGPVTLHRLGRSSESPTIFPTTPTPHDVVLVIAGEIDIRCHVDVQTRERGRSLDEVLSALASSACRCAESLCAAFDVEVFFSAVIPPSRENTEIESELVEYPFRGTLEQRAGWTTNLNELLVETLGSKVLDPYAPIRDEGVLPQEISDGEVHVSEEYGSRFFNPVAEEIVRRCGL